MTERRSCVRHLFVATLTLIALGCPEPEPPSPTRGGSTLSSRLKRLTLRCDGTFDGVIEFSNTGQTEVSLSGAFNPKTDFSEISTASPDFKVPSKGIRDIDFSGKLKDPCKAGLTQFEVTPAGQVAPVAINVRDVPFRTIEVPGSTTATGGMYSYAVRLTCCRTMPPPMNITIEAGALSGTTIGAITPQTVTCPGGEQTVTVSGKLTNELGGSVRLRAIEPGGAIYCVLPTTQVN